MFNVNIVLSDRGWILERLAAEIASRYEYVTYSTEVNPNAPIQYYMTYGTWKGRVSPFEIGYFAHLEPHGEARDKFFHVANNADHCVCHSKLYEDLLRQEGINNVTTISPGVDLDYFTPKIKIGVVGRTYHTGRKGERLVADVLDIPEIEWHFTGDGWPYPGLDLPDEKMPDFYRSMDYILVPSLYEGGPMCVVEALACGKEVIAPAVGWVPQFPHIEFETGNSQDLRRVLNQLVKNRLALRESVLERTWENWAAGHDKVFRQCYEKLKYSGKTVSLPIDNFHASFNAKLSQVKIGLVMHGNEHKAKGGPSVRVPKTAQCLRQEGLKAEPLTYPAKDISSYELIHAFNVWNPQSALNLLKAVKYHNKPLIFSSIFLDLSEREGFSSEVVRVFKETKSPQEINAKLELLRHSGIISTDLYKQGIEPIPGYFAQVKKMVELADHLILLSQKEKQLLEAVGADLKASSIVHNPVDATVFRNADSELFKKHYDIDDYVLCVGRIEVRKNQLMLAHALRDCDIPIVLIGHSPGGDYINLIKEIGGKNLIIIDRLLPESNMLASAIAGARVFTLPSWSEGASLAVLEAAAAGANLVLSNRSSEQEYFGDYARFCDPGDPESIKNAVMAAYENPTDRLKRKQQQDYVAREFSWEVYTRKTIEVYQKVLEQGNTKGIPTRVSPGLNSKMVEPDTIYIDITTSAHHQGRWTGISRLEYMLAQYFYDILPYHVKYIAWNSQTKRFWEVLPPQSMTQEQLSFVARETIDTLPDFISEPKFEGNSLVFMMGSAWMQNPRYVNSLLHTCANNQLLLAVAIADLIPVKFPEWMPSGYAKTFVANLKLLMQHSDLLFAISKHTKKDMLEFAQQNSILIPNINVMRLGDIILEDYSVASEEAHQNPFHQIKPHQFILNVGAIHFRKNQQLLYNIWRRLVDDLGAKAPTLVIVGGFAWNANNFAGLLDGNPILKEKIIVLKDIDDENLSWLYRNCLFTVYPSLYEGWGLPVAESLCYGKFCIASNLSSIPEIAPDVTKLIDPLDTLGWYNAIKFYVTSKQALKSAEQRIKKEYKATSWLDAARQVKSLLKYPYKWETDKHEYFFGEVLDFSKQYEVIKYQSGGWFPSESWGSWTLGNLASLQFKVDSLPSQFLRLEALCGAYIIKSKHPHIFVQVYANEQYLTTWNFYDDSLAGYYVNIPANILGSSGQLKITFCIFEPTTPKIAQGKDDNRLLGLKVSKMRLINPSYHRDSLSNYYPDLPVKPVYVFNSTLKLTENKNAELVFVDPYHKDSNWGCFTTDTVTKLVIFPNTQPEDDVELNLTIRPVANADFPLNCLVIVNGCLVGKLKATDSKLTECSVVIPARVFRLMLPVAIEFQSEVARSPLELNIDNNSQKFLFGISHVSLNKITQKANVGFKISGSQEDNPYKFGEVLDFTQYSKMRPILGSDWHFYEPDGIWSSQEKVSIYLNLNVLPSSDLVLLMMIEFPYGGDFSQLRLSVNDKLLDSSVFVSHGIVWCRCSIPRGVLLATQIKITLSAPLVSICKVERLTFQVGIKLSKMIIS